MTFGGETAESYYDDGLTASMKGELDRAKACFEKALQLDPTYFAAMHQLAKVAMRTGDLPQAVGLLVKVIRDKPRLIPPRLDLGQVLLSQGNVPQAREVFGQILGVEPANSRAILGIAQVLFQEGDWMGAEARAAESMQHGGINFPALYLQGRAAKLAGNRPMAVECLERADKLVEKSLELTPDQPEGHYLRGEVHFALERYSDALEHYKRAADRAQGGRTYSAYGDTFNRLDLLAKQGLCYERLDLADQAREIGERILKADPSHKLGRALQGGGE